MIRAILFDMDGTLVDSEPFYYKRKRAYLLSRNLPHDDALLKQFVGRDMRDFFTFMFDGDKKLSVTYFDDYQAYILNHPANYTAMLFPEVHEVLAFCKQRGYRLALVSSSPWGNIRAMLKQCHLENSFDVVISGSDMTITKPDPQVYVEAMKQLSLAPLQCLVIEDSYSGILAGASAGCKVIVRGQPPAKLPDHLIFHQVDNLKELLPILNTLMEL